MTKMFFIITNTGPESILIDNRFITGGLVCFIAYLAVKLAVAIIGKDN